MSAGAEIDKKLNYAKKFINWLNNKNKYDLLPSPETFVILPASKSFKRAAFAPKEEEKT